MYSVGLPVAKLLSGTTRVMHHSITFAQRCNCGGEPPLGLSSLQCGDMSYSDAACLPRRPSIPSDTNNSIAAIMTSDASFPAPRTAIPLVFGAMTVGEAGKAQVRISDEPTFQRILDTLKAHGHDELDTSRVYGSSSSEEFLGRIAAEKQGFRIATKNWPSKSRPLGNDWKEYDHTPKGIQQSLDDSLNALKTESVDLYYLHAPDRQNSFFDTLKALDVHHRQGRFKRLGISNFRADEVEEVMRICAENHFVKPTVYQGLYNAIVRTAEEPLLPVLRKHRISFYTYNPLGGSFFTGAIKPEHREQAVEQGSRFDKDTWQGQAYRKRYFHDAFFEALDLVRAAAEQEKLTMAEVALRWCMHHSALSKDYNDHVIFSASSIAHVEQNLLDFEKGPLPSNVVHTVDQAWQKIADSKCAPAYHF